VNKHPKTPISVIIPVSSLVHKAISKRLETIKRAVRDFYQGVDVIVVEQSFDGKFYFLPHLEGVKKIELKHPVFNKGWCLNVGARQAPNNYLVFADADMYARDVCWSRLYQWMKQGYLWSFAWNRLIYTDIYQRDQIFRYNKSMPGLPYTTPKPGYSEGGLVCFYKPFFYEIGQYNECFTELGGIDNEIILRAKSVYKFYPMFPLVVYHMTHPQVKKSSRPTRKANIRRLKQTRNRTGEMIEWLKEQNQGGMNGPLSDRKEIWG
jgi:hypothetical protein